MYRICVISLSSLFITMVSLCGCASNDKADEARLAALSGDHVVSFKVEGMACRNCANEIARELEEVPGVMAAMIDFDTATAKVALDPDPSRAATMEQLQSAVEHWRKEHVSAKVDSDCLDPQRREELQRASGAK
jgi:copper chaperone CopZ